MPPPAPHLGMQWHITAKCGNRCRHCYMYESKTYRSELEHGLDLGGLLAVLDRVGEFEDKWGAGIDRIAVTGGDPLLHESWRELVADIRRRGKRVALLGNPETLTEAAVSCLADLGVREFQMSLDGMEETHDSFRSEGSFRRTLSKLELLARHGVRGQIMFTLFPANAGELVPLLRYLAEKSAAASFAFDIGCFVGNAGPLASGSDGELVGRFTPTDVRRTFREYLEEKRRLKAEGRGLLVAEKPHLFRVARFEEGGFYPVASPGFPVVGGCMCGWTGFSVLADGTVLACRRMPLEVGKLPDQSLEDILLGSETMRRFRRPESFAGCGRCDFYKFCRGCPAYVFSVTGGDPFAEHPLCFRSRVPRSTGEGPTVHAGPPMDVSREEEFELLAGRFSTAEPHWRSALFEDEDTRHVFVTLAFSPEARRAYLADPHGHLESVGRRLPDDGHTLLMEHFSPDRWAGPGELPGDKSAPQMSRRDLPGDKSAPQMSRPSLPNVGPGNPVAVGLIEKMLRQGARVETPELRKLVAMAWEDEGFRKALTTDPIRTIERTLGITLPSWLEIRVHEQTPEVLHILLPGGPPLTGGGA